MAKLRSLFPIPGSKRFEKYNFLQPLAHQKTICEPFMGGAATSLRTGLQPILGEINPSLRQIAETPTTGLFSNLFIEGYEFYASWFTEGIDLGKLLSYTELKQSQKQVNAEIPGIYAELTTRWGSLTAMLFREMQVGSLQTGCYAFCQRTCFGNAMRLNPSGDAFNVSWHVNKLKSALNFNPQQWCDQLNAQGWNPIVCDDWQSAIEAVRCVEDTYLLLDPPYIEADGDRKMTPCYPGHVVTGDGRESTYSLAIEPLKLAMQKGFLKIDLSNYYSDRLDKDVFYLAEEYEYSIKRTEVGECGALGNSNGRLKHGKRRDTRPKPIEYVWTLESIF